MSGIHTDIRFDTTQPSVSVIGTMMQKMFSHGPDSYGTMLRVNSCFEHRFLMSVDIRKESRQTMSDPFPWALISFLKGAYIFSLTQIGDVSHRIK